jgi:hypothetical protein
MKKVSLFQKVAGLVVLGSFAFADDPTIYGQAISVDYTDFKSAVVLAIGVTITVMLARKAKSFLRG